MTQWTLQALARELARIEQRVDNAVPRELHRAEIDALKEDVRHLTTKLDRMLDSQVTAHRTQILQLIMIIVTLVVAGIGAVT